MAVVTPETLIGVMPIIIIFFLLQWYFRYVTALHRHTMLVAAGHPCGRYSGSLNVTLVAIPYRGRCYRCLNATLVAASGRTLLNRYYPCAGNACCNFSAWML
jgi:hypothetical protein